MINILIVEKNLKYATQILNKLSKSLKNLRFCGIVTSKKSLYEFIQDFKIDIFLIDYEIFKELNYKYLQSYNNSIIVISQNTTSIPRSLLKINYFSSIDKLETQIKKLLSKQEINFYNQTLKNHIKEELDYLNYNTSYKGYLYLLEAIYIINILHKSSEYNLSKYIYPIIAKKFNTSPLNVKYNIRNATEAMYFNCEEQKLHKYLKYTVLETPKTKDIIDAIQTKLLIFDN